MKLELTYENQFVWEIEAVEEKEKEYFFDMLKYTEREVVLVETERFVYIVKTEGLEKARYIV